MAKKVIVFNQFTGGLSDGPKTGIKYSSAYLQALDVRTDPGQMSVLPGMVREDNGIIKDLILNEVMAADGTIYAFGNAGFIYRRTTAGVWSELGNVSTGCAGLDYRFDTDMLYLASQKTVSAYGPVTGLSGMTGTPQLIPDKYASSFSTYDNSANTAPLYVAANQTGNTKAVVPQTTIAEVQAQLRYFQTDIEPLNKISVFVIAKGTGDWTLTLHDGLNNVLGSATIPNANLNNNAFNDFIFSSAPNGQVRVYPAPNARTYHIHVTSTVADGVMSASTAFDMSTCDLEVWADRLVNTRSGFHPIDRFLQYEIIGNGNYISAWEPISDPPTNDEWQRLRLTVPMEYDCVGVTHTNEYSIAAWGQYTSTGTSTQQAGLLTFWSGTSDTYDYDVPIKEGTPQALHVYMNVAYYYAAGTWWAITSPTTQPVKQKQLPKGNPRFTPSSTPITMNPYAATVDTNGYQLLGYPGATTNPNINVGVYSWGALNKNYPAVLTYDYLPSTGSQNYSTSNNLQIGMVKSFGDLVHLSWRDDQGSGTPKYGIDVLNNTSPPAPYAKYQPLIIDNAYAAKKKTGAYIEAYYPNLPAGATIRLGYSIDRGAFVVDKNIYSTTNLWQGENGYCRFDITQTSAGLPGGNWREIQAQVEIWCASGTTTPPAIPTVALVLDDNRERVLK